MKRLQKERYHPACSSGCSHSYAVRSITLPSYPLRNSYKGGVRRWGFHLCQRHLFIVAFRCLTLADRRAFHIASGEVKYIMIVSSLLSNAF